MASNVRDISLNASSQFENENNNSAFDSNFSKQSHQQRINQNASFGDGCIEVRFKDLEYLPRDNPDNIVSAEVEMISHRIKDNLLGLLFLIGGPANVINMAVFYKQGLQDRVNLCLFALSLADELFLIASMLYHGEQLHLQFTTKERYGPMMTFLTNINVPGFAGFSFVSPVLSAIIATERCLCILNPLKFQTLLRTRTMAAIIVVVHVSVLSMYFIVAFRFRVGCVYDPETDAIIRTPVDGDFYKAHKQFINFLDGFVFGASLPGIVMIVVITTTVITVLKLRQIVSWRASTSSLISQREVALTKMLVCNSMLFIICICPIAVIRFSWLFFPEMSSGGRNQNFFLSGVWVTEMFSFINATFNIFVYYAMGSRYRETFWALFGRKQKTNKA